MHGWWRLNRVKLRFLFFMVLHSLLFTSCLCLNTEGLALMKLKERVERDPFNALSSWNGRDGDFDPCSWFGVECSMGKVVILHLKDLCLEGTLAPELGNLASIRSIILRNNSFSGNIPKEIGELKDLEVLDLGHNNFSGPFPSEFSNNPSLATLLLDNNNFLGGVSPELHELMVLSEIQADENLLTASYNSRGYVRNSEQPGGFHRMLLQATGFASPPGSANPPEGRHLIPAPSSSESPKVSPSSPSPAPSPSQTPSESPRLSPSSPSSTPSRSPSPSQSPSESSELSSSSPTLAPAPSPALSPSSPRSRSPSQSSVPLPVLLPPSLTPNFVPNATLSSNRHFKSKNLMILIGGFLGGGLFILVSAIAFIFVRSSKVVAIMPWTTGLSSGHHQNAFMAGVQRLKRSELEAACEDFSNIIGSFVDGTVYKGTLSSGVEIAVTCPALKSREDWTQNLEAHFRKKIDTLSKINHKNFASLIGYCEEDEPFTRMMVFEYAPNGALFEHLHIKEAEHLNWKTRLSIAMDVAYCLDYMHNLTPPAAHTSLTSSCIYLTEDYAAKISDFSFSTYVAKSIMEPPHKEFSVSTSVDVQSNICRFGLLLLEMVTGRSPYAADNVTLGTWALEYLRGEWPLQEVVDPTLQPLKEDELERLTNVINCCTISYSNQRPTMADIALMLKEINAMEPDVATSKSSPLWWAELEIMSREES